MTTISEAVLHVFRIVVDDLGPTFSLPALTLFTASCRGKRLRFEEDAALPLEETGRCQVLTDCDLISTPPGLDEIAKDVATLHELAHLLLGHLPRFPQSGTMLTSAVHPFATPPTAAPIPHPTTTIVCRAHGTIYDDPREQDAETLATLLFDAIIRERTALPAFVKDLHGWNSWL